MPLFGPMVHLSFCPRPLLAHCSRIDLSWSLSLSPPKPSAHAENQEQLRADIEAVESAEGALQQKSSEERQKVDELRTELERLTAQESRLPPEQERLTQQLSQTRTLVTQREAGCAQSLTSKEQKLGELDKGCALYRSRLGLTFERVGDERLRLTFTNIDPSAPMRPFAFQVFVDGGDKYHVESCEPAVPGIDELIQTLNSDNDFSAFVRAMRKRFKALA
jgi:kinetochore protein Spc25